MSTTREQRIVRTFVELADTMVDEFDVAEFLHRVTERCVELLDCDEAGVLLADAGGRLSVMASSSERADALDVMQTQNSEGPCFDCYVTGQVVSSSDLDAESERWPRFHAEALAHGFRAAAAIPMRVRGTTVGALNLFRAEPGDIDERAFPLGQGMADIAAVAILQARAVRESRVLAEQLQTALSSRVVIEQAKGVLAEQGTITVDAAFGLIRAYTRAGNLKLSEVALAIVGGDLSFADVTRGSALR
jgi:GAF domain-containing protein